MTPRQYYSPEHESLLAVGRCLRLHRGQADAGYRVSALLAQFGVAGLFELSPFGAHFCRKLLEAQLPKSGDGTQ